MCYRPLFLFKAHLQRRRPTKRSVQNAIRIPVRENLEWEIAPSRCMVPAAANFHPSALWQV
jgi:hypothetical protein